MSGARGRLTRYSIYQLRDYFVERGLPALLVGVLVGWTMLLEVRVRYGLAWLDRPDAVDLSDLTLRAALNQFGFLAILISVSGIIANDRRHGYFRLFFAKPVSAVRYYFQAFVAAGVGLMAVSAALHVLWGFVAIPVPPWGTLRALSFYYAIVGGTAFLMSSLVRWDWVATGIVWGGSMILRAVYQRDSGIIAWIVRHFTAPTHLVEAMRDQLYRGVSPPADHLLWAFAYAAACITGALLVVRFRPMAS